MADLPDLGADGADRLLQKMEIDYSTTVNEKLPQYEQQAKRGDINGAIEGLLSLEKQTRSGADAISTGRILVCIVRICYEAKKYDLLNEHIVQLTKRRGQLKQAVTSMVQEACTYIEKIQDKPTKLKLIDTLRTVTAGKIYVEIERARLSMTLSKIKEADGDVAEAAAVLQELQVETFGRMENKEKVEFILEQMRLCLARKDYIRAQIVSKKITSKFFEEKDSEDLKLKYYHLMIELDQHESSYLAICRHWMAVYNTPSVNSDPTKRNEALACMVMYLVLSPYTNDQNDLTHRVKEDVNLEQLTTFKEMLELFTTEELMSWKDLCARFEKTLRSAAPGNTVFSASTDSGKQRWTDLKNRVVEHNIRVMSKYYTRIRLTRMAQLLDLNIQETEQFLSSLVVSKTIEARIDRLDGTVSFSRVKPPDEVLNDWSHNVNSLMALVNQATHLITKELMVHNQA